ncbi:TOM1-like protein 2 isoform X1 [Pomacea canaliculata]|uniref:TOM1-like protein 2 isoform X1 n=1 Tax=Pomacea canaliculata TaxID=400727 RepID=UPI000D7378DD|nr:TOM1-like protein 2 isoform X1 [Pomacea canaliculata]
MAALFGHGNPLSTPVGQLIERATDAAQASENWALFMEVCDYINETDDGPKDAVRAFKKRLSQNVGKNFTAVMYTLICLETAVKNCERRFHCFVATKDFLQELVKIIGPKYDPPQAVQEKVLQMIQTWADAFRGVPELKEVDKTYQELKSKGIEFPMTDLDNMAPIHTPARSVPLSTPEKQRGNHNSSPHGYQLSPTQTGRTAVPPASTEVVPAVANQPVSLTPEQKTKLSRELGVVSGNVRVMSEMLTELSPMNVDPSDLELLLELNRTCRQMQQRILVLLEEVANEECTNELLRVNDDLNNVFLRYERFERYRSGQGASEAAEPSPGQDQLPPSYDQIFTPKNEDNRLPGQSNPSVGNLIDFEEEGQLAVTTKMAPLNTCSNASVATSSAPAAAADEDFDMFAQSRQSFEQNKQTSGKTAYGNQQEDQFAAGLGIAVNVKAQPDVLQLQEKDSDYDEMEQWLATNKPQGGAAASGSKP